MLSESSDQLSNEHDSTSAFRWKNNQGLAFFHTNKTQQKKFIRTSGYNDIERLWKAGLEYEKHFKYDDAIECFERIIALKPESLSFVTLPEIQKHCASSYYAKEEYKRRNSSGWLSRLSFNVARNRGNNYLSSFAIKYVELDDSWYSFIHEVLMHSELKHPNIVLLYAVCTSPLKRCLILEFMNEGSLRDYLQNKFNALDENQRKFIRKEIVKGLHFLHQNNIVHQDIKSQNILINQVGEQLEIKITDFGFSNKVGSTTLNRTHKYAAPELIPSGLCSQPSDVYAFGVVLWEIETGQVPYRQMSEFQFEKLIEQHKTLKIPSHTSNETASLISDCWRLDPEERPTAEMLEHRLTV